MADEETYSAEWEMVDSGQAQIRQFRQRVPGGWIVLCNMEESTATTFVPDPDGRWTPPLKQGRKKGGYY